MIFYIGAPPLDAVFALAKLPECDETVCFG